MARSAAVWVVIDDSTSMPIAAFTVKHELCTWLYKHENPQSLTHLHGWKVLDGYRHWLDSKTAGPWSLDLMYLRSLGEQADQAKKKAQQDLKDWRG